MVNPILGYRSILNGNEFQSTTTDSDEVLPKGTNITGRIDHFIMNLAKNTSCALRAQNFIKFCGKNQTFNILIV